MKPYRVIPAWTHRMTTEEKLAAMRYQELRDARKIVAIGIGDIYLGDIVRGRVSMSFPDLPEDAVYMDAHLDPRSRSVIVFWGHESFESVPDGMEVPNLSAVTISYKDLS